MHVLRQFMRFSLVGALCTPIYLGLYLALRGPLGPAAANAVALLVATVVNTVANGRFTFGGQNAGWRLRAQVESLVVFGISLALTGGALAALRALDPHAGTATELSMLVAASIGGAWLRLLLLRAWVFRPAALFQPAPPTE
jgi:putative flippase GtrA